MNGAKNHSRGVLGRAKLLPDQGAPESLETKEQSCHTTKKVIQLSSA